MLYQKQDLTFVRTAAASPRKLPQADIERYNRDAFVQPFDMFDHAYIAVNRVYFDRLVADMGEDGAYGINCYQARMAGIWDIDTAPRVLDYVGDIIGPNIVCWASAILPKKPRNLRQVLWHQDGSFWSLSSARSVTVWLTINDADTENFATRFLPGSHDKSALPIKPTDDASLFHIGTDGTEEMGEPFVTALKAWQISLHADMLVHGSLPIASHRRCCGLTLRYCPPEGRITDSDWAKGVEEIVARGEDASRHWTHHPRPSNDDIRATTSPRNLFRN